MTSISGLNYATPVTSKNCIHLFLRLPSSNILQVYQSIILWAVPKTEDFFIIHLLTQFPPTLNKASLRSIYSSVMLHSHQHETPKYFILNLIWKMSSFIDFRILNSECSNSRARPRTMSFILLSTHLTELTIHQKIKASRPLLNPEVKSHTSKH